MGFFLSRYSILRGKRSSDVDLRVKMPEDPTSFHGKLGVHFYFRP
jgi:hypothetical protein